MASGAPSVRPFRPADGDAIAAITTAYGLTDSASVAAPAYRQLLVERGRLVVAEQDSTVIGFAGMLDVDGVAMISDVFVDALRQGGGVGTAMVAALVDGYSQRMTNASSHPAAQPLYERFGLVPRWPLRYVQGQVVHEASDASVTELSIDDAAIDRPELTQLSDGRWLALDDAGARVGLAFVTMQGALAFIERLVTSGDHIDALRAVLRTCPLNARVMACVPAVSPASTWLDSVGFHEDDTDLHMATPTVPDHPHWVCIHPGMA